MFTDISAGLKNIVSAGICSKHDRFTVQQESSFYLPGEPRCFFRKLEIYLIFCLHHIPYLEVK